MNVYEIEWTVRHKYLRTLNSEDMAQLRTDFRLPDAASDDDVLEALYEHPKAEDILLEMAAGDRYWVDADDAQMLLHNTVSGAKT